MDIGMRIRSPEAADLILRNSRASNHRSWMLIFDGA